MTDNNFLKAMSSKMSLTNSQLYLKITPCYCASPHFDPLYVRPLSSRPLYPHMIMCKNAIAACNDKNVWVQSVYIFPLFTNEKNGIWLLCFLPSSEAQAFEFIYTHITLYFKGKFRGKMNMILFFRNNSKFENNYLCISKRAGYLIFQYAYHICREWISNDPKWMVFHVHFCLLNRPFK